MGRYKVIAVINLLLLLGFINYSIVKKEILLRKGMLIFLELTPVDPRSLIQGDYMELSYTILNRIDTEIRRGYCIISIDSDGIAHYVRHQQYKMPLYENEHLLRYKSKGWTAVIGQESFFFQEGYGQRFETARYGGLRIDKKGKSILYGLYDENLRKIE